MAKSREYWTFAGLRFPLDSPADRGTTTVLRGQGVIAGMRRLVFRYGTRRFGKPDASIAATFDELHCFDHFDIMIDRIFEGTARNWNEVIAGIVEVEEDEAPPQRSESGPR